MPPALECKQKARMIMDEVSGMKEIPILDFVESAFDNKTAFDNLIFKANDREGDYIFTCDSFVCHGADDRIFLNIQVTCEDESGNINRCISELEILDSLDICTSERLELSVELLTLSEREPLGGFEFAFIDQFGERVSTTGDIYPISFPSRICHTLEGTLYPKRSAKNELNGVSFKDYVKLLRHLQGLTVFDQPYQYIAADINGDLQINVSDLSLLRKLITTEKSIADIPFQSSWQIFSSEAPIESDWTSWVDHVYLDIRNTSPNPVRYLAVKLGDLSLDAR